VLGVDTPVSTEIFIKEHAFGPMYSGGIRAGFLVAVRGRQVCYSTKPNALSEPYLRLTTIDDCYADAKIAWEEWERELVNYSLDLQRYASGIGALAKGQI
jgi:hypothetical protein